MIFSFESIGFLVCLSLLVGLIFFIASIATASFRASLLERFSNNWVKAWLVNNFVSIVVIFLAVFLFFFLSAYFSPSSEVPEDLVLTPIDVIGLILLGLVRIVIVSIPLSMLLVVSVMLSSIAITFFESLGINKIIGNFLCRFLGCVVSAFILLLIIELFFSWLPAGVFIFVFYGKINALGLPG